MEEENIQEEIALILIPLIIMFILQQKMGKHIFLIPILFGIVQQVMFLLI